MGKFVEQFRPLPERPETLDEAYALIKTLWQAFQWSLEKQGLHSGNSSTQPSQDRLSGRAKDFRGRRSDRALFPGGPLRQLLEPFAGILISDRRGAYGVHSKTQRQLCWAHVVRTLERISGRKGDPGESGLWLVRVARFIIRLEHNWRRSAYRSRITDGDSNKPALVSACIPISLPACDLWATPR